MLGPHVVGQRVVVRRVLPGETGPTGGPAMTDVLGVCESWADGVVSVRRDDGTVVSFASADIVSGKPVPPRPSVRMRISARDAERHALALWPRLDLEPLGEWVLRHDPAPIGRLRKRASSCLAFGEAPPDAVTTVTAFYAARGRTPLAQVEADSPAESLFADAGWVVVPGGEAHFLLASVSTVLRRIGPPSAEVTVTQHGVVLAGAVDDAATVEAALDDDWVGVHGLHVMPERRREGLARAVLAGALERAAEQGATTAWLHVETDNAPALALYDDLGFVVHHTSRYLIPQGSQITEFDGR